jgi:hypothetical protein
MSDAYSLLKQEGVIMSENEIIGTMDEMNELDLTEAQLDRLDEIDNAVHECICVLAEKEIPWDMELIGETLDAIKQVLLAKKIRVRHPGYLVELNGSNHYLEREQF